MRTGWRWFGLGLLLCGSIGMAEADEAVLNSPSKAVQTVKTVVDLLQPGADTIYNLWNVNDKGGEWLRGLSISLWNPTDNDIPIASVRLGYIGEDENFSDARGVYGGINANLPSLSQYIPSSIKGIATAGYLDALWSFAGKYGRAGVIGGWDADASTPIAGVNFGAALTW